ncbi:MAG: hypothetical protein G01um101433_198 [Parcubacteria group bacterium Gr01-1014_33]|nr:MAG: hypothetical protein G01um101433_198 [Parcubacteria group bacterium Gr01-1014_33]
MRISHSIDELAKKIWDYHLMRYALEKADCILVLGSNDTRVAEWGATLFLDGWAPLLVFSGTGAGHKNDLLATGWDLPEAEIFAEIAIKRGVPKDKILVENYSENTGENILFTKELLKSRGINLQKFILVQKPYMERRAYATFKKLWPEKEVIITSPPISYEEYPAGAISKEILVNIMVGDLQRIKLYAEKGFQIPQEIPEDVWKAYEKLVELGYMKHLVRE